MYNNKRYTKIVAQALREFFETGNTKQTESKYANADEPPKACFVTLKTSNDKLRGCIGTIKPRYKNLPLEIIKNSVSAAEHDPRFPPVQAEEFNDLKISTEVLEDPIEISADQLPDPKEYGLIIEEPRSGKRGVLLPNIPGIETSEQQVNIIKRKAGIGTENHDKLKFFKFETAKYE